MCLYGIDIFQSKDRFFTFGVHWKNKFQICNIQVGNLTKEKFKKDYFSSTSIGNNLDQKQKDEIRSLCFRNSEAF